MRPSSNKGILKDAPDFEMSYLYRIIALFCLGWAVVDADWTVLYPMLSVISKDFKLSGKEMGVITSTYFFFYTTAQLVSGMLGDRFGLKRVLVFFSFIAALGIAALSSFFGGIIGVLILMLFAPWVARFARDISSWEFALLGILGLTLIAYVASGPLYKGLAGGAIGLLIATVGQDIMTAYPPFVGTETDLLGGFDLVVLLIGFFGIAEVLTQIESGLKVSIVQNLKGTFGPILRDVARHWGTLYAQLCLALSSAPFQARAVASPT